MGKNNFTKKLRIPINKFIILHQIHNILRIQSPLPLNLLQLLLHLLLPLLLLKCLLQNESLFHYFVLGLLARFRIRQDFEIAVRNELP